jgi:transcriptional regulator with XRE-family HTH domain
MGAMKGAHLIVEARRRAGLTQAELASRVGTTQSAIARVEQARGSPSLEYLTRLLRACGFDLDVRLVPYDSHDWTLAEQNRLLNPADRLEKMLATARLRGAAVRGMGEG